MNKLESEIIEVEELEDEFELIFMDEEEFDTKINTLWNEYEENNTINEELYKQLICEPKEEMDNESYLKLMFLSALQYEKQGNQRAMHYCAIRMQNIIDCMAGKTKRVPAVMIFHEYELTNDMQVFVETYYSFILDAKKYVKSKLYMISAISVFALFMIFCFLFKFSVGLSLFQAVLLGGLNHLFTLRKMPQMLEKKQTDTLSADIDVDLKEFDRRIRYM